MFGQDHDDHRGKHQVERSYVVSMCHYIKSVNDLYGKRRRR